MSREKQIEEMARTIGRNRMACDRDDCKKCSSHEKCLYQDIACGLYNAGYRKQSVGEWISNELGGYKYAFYCSECGWVDGYPFNDRHKFCPNCGAKMKGGAE